MNTNTLAAGVIGCLLGGLGYPSPPSSRTTEPPAGARRRHFPVHRRPSTFERDLTRHRAMRNADLGESYGAASMVLLCSHSGPYLRSAEYAWAVWPFAVGRRHGTLRLVGAIRS